MNSQSLPATEVKNRFGRVLRQIAKTGGPIIVERDGKPVAVILSMSEYQRMQPQAIPDDKQRDLLKEAFGLWSQRTEIDEEWLADGRSRWESTWANE
jgi:prevent-host-death family protein